MTPTIVNRGDGPKIAGTRITVYTVLEYLRAGWDQKSIAILLGISSSQVEAAERYIEEHKNEVLPAFEKIMERIARGNPPEVQAKLDATHERFMEKVHQIRAAKSKLGNGASDAETAAGH
ncbi:MAG: DUF433 domain-containing protein [Planctomycetaceae bacterium]